MIAVEISAVLSARCMAGRSDRSSPSWVIRIRPVTSPLFSVRLQTPFSLLCRRGGCAECARPETLQICPPKKSDALRAATSKSGNPRKKSGNPGKAWQLQKSRTTPEKTSKCGVCATFGRRVAPCFVYPGTGTAVFPQYRYRSIKKQAKQLI